MAYIIKNNAIIAKTKIELKSGTLVQYAFNSCKEEINANRELNLVNAKTGKIGNGAKWDRAWAKIENGNFATEINPNEFLVR